jgi:hypothetical protein
METSKNKKYIQGLPCDNATVKMLSRSGQPYDDDFLSPQ